MIKIKQEKGITLIALVITIIVLVILAGVVLAMVMGDSGIFSKANTSREQTNIAQAKEDIRLKILEVKTENKGIMTIESLMQKLDDSQDEYVVTTTSKTATLVAGEDSDGITDVTALNEHEGSIYVTNLTYGVEVEIQEGEFQKADMESEEETEPVAEPTEYRYIRMHITKIRDVPFVNAIQLADIRLYNTNRTLYTYPSTATVTSNLAPASTAASGDERPIKLIDNNSSTKFCSTQWGSSRTGNCIITIDLGEGNEINLEEYPYYTYYTANDETSRDPVSWTIQVSNDDITYRTIDIRTDENIVTSRRAQCTSSFFEWNNY